MESEFDETNIKSIDLRMDHQLIAHKLNDHFNDLSSLSFLLQSRERSFLSHETRQDQDF